ncbi:hypothetical protein TNCV_971641 [Trichonephila clavipes]|nr:hypothetical protein TNCV_971641 [Trichonephila clavipes]
MALTIVKQYETAVIEWLANGGHGHELLASIVTSRTRNLIPLNNHRVKVLIHVKSVEAPNPPVGVVWN